MKEISRLTNVAILAALEAGNILKKGFGSDFKTSFKEWKHNLVTEYDHLSEETIIKSISSHFPDHTFLAEESGLSSKRDDVVQWIIDPLDGTVNFAHQIPLFSVSIAAAFQNEILCGVVYAPMLDELFVGEKGNGAFLNGRKIRCTEVKKLDEAFIGFGLPYNTFDNPEGLLDQIRYLGKKGLPMRRMGSAAIDISYVAAGRFDGFWETLLSPWDYAAGKLILEEAGGIFTHLDAEPYSKLIPGGVAASNGHIHKEFLEELSKGKKSNTSE